MIRAYDLAKALGISSKELLERLEQSGLHLKSHSSNVDEDQVRSLLDVAAREKKGRPKPKSHEVPASTRVTPVERKRPRTGKAEAPAPVPETPTPRPARPKSVEAKTVSEATPLSERITPAERASPVGQKGPHRPKAEAPQQPSQATAVMKPPPSVPTEPVRQAAAPAPRVKEAPSRAAGPPAPGAVPGQRATVIPAAPEPQVQAEQVQRESPVPTRPIVKMAETITVKELADGIAMSPSEIIKQLIKMGIMTTINQPLDVEIVKRAADRIGFSVEVMPLEEAATGAEEREDPSLLLPRSPVVTIMGHVDHGKTSLLDAIRNAKVVEGEAGGITQHIGAYQITTDSGAVLTFLDTPGHEAFTAMRARGAQSTDLVVLVVAADDGVMPQTVEAINHAKAAGVPIIVAVNKIDLPQADPGKIKQELTSYGLVSEEWGGDTIFVEVSAKKGIKIKELLEMILLQAEVLELKATPDSAARGIVVEAKLDKGRGPVSTVLIQDGSLKVGDAIVTGMHYGRVRAMISDWGKRVESAGPSMPIEILGLSGVPLAGDTFVAVKDEATAKQIAAIRERKSIERERLKTAKVSLTDLYDKINKGEVKELNLIIKADVQGSIEAVKETLGKLSTDAVKIRVIHSAAGGINEGDVMLAAASNAIVVGFNIRPDAKAQSLAERENVDVRLYDIIYNLVDEIKAAMEGMLSPVVKEEVMGRATVREVFRITKVGNVAGCFMTDGKAVRGAKARLVRDSVVVYDGKLSSLKRFKDDVKEVASGFECGMTIDGYNDIKVGDVIELYVLKEEAAKL